MLDIRLIRQEIETVRRALARRGAEDRTGEILKLDEARRSALFKAETLKSEQNAVSKKIPAMKKAGENVEAVFEEMKSLSNQIKELDEEIRVLDERIEALMLSIPNIPHESVPDGATDDDNLEVRRVGEPVKFDFEPKPHWEIGEALGVLDFEAAAKVAGARFTVYRGLGARLERAVVNFFLDTHAENHGYTEIFPPYMVRRRSMVGTGQLPKFEEDAFKVTGTDYFLIPTAEVPVTNLYREQILSADALPVKHVAYSACFRAEAGSAGRDTRGLIRQHQFNKVELVKFTTPETSYEELEKLVNDAENVLKALQIPYRVVKICVGDLGFTAALKYDLEVWLPSYGRYVEISSCSNFEDFQARRAGIRFRSDSKEKPRFVHTLNGSGVAVGRAVACILENFQNADGSVNVPEALIPYMRGVTKIDARGVT